ncbi:MAG: hypothetical protein ACE5FA_02975, partial [Dehalococcoidia bacterium]
NGKTTAATVLDGNGSPLTGTTQVQVDFASANRPIVVPGRHHLFKLDLDFNQALTVDTTANTVTFDPVISAVLDPTNTLPIAASGILKSIDSANQKFVLEKRTPTGTAIGDITVQASSTTVYQIDGVVSLGNAGLTALGTLTLGTTRVFVQGTLDQTAQVLNALAVESGAGTFGNGQDWVIGVITARDTAAGNNAALTVLGRSKDVSTGSRTFNTSHTVNVSFSQTKVLRRGAGNFLNSDALNVGQAVIAFGTLTGTTLDAAPATGVVRMLPTSVWGTANALPSGNTLTLNVSRIALRSIGQFNFTVATISEATSSAFTVDVTGLSTTGITAGAKIRAIGFVNPVSITTDDNFDATALVNHSTEARVLLIKWTPPTANPIQSTSSGASLDLDVGTASKKIVADGFADVTLGTQVSVLPRAAAGVYVIAKNGAVQLHLDFAAFEGSLVSQVSGTSTVSRISALGTFDSTTKEFKANAVSVILK